MREKDRGRDGERETVTKHRDTKRDRERERERERPGVSETARDERGGERGQES